MTINEKALEAAQKAAEEKEWTIRSIITAYRNAIEPVGDNEILDIIYHANYEKTFAGEYDNYHMQECKNILSALRSRGIIGGK